MRTEPRVAFVTDALPTIGGAEKTLFAALECFPKADVFSLVYNRGEFLNSPLAGRRVFTSYLDRFPLVGRYYRLLLPLMPRAVERLRLAGYDIVVSFNYAVANGAQARGARHFSYTHTPMRYAWRDQSISGGASGNNLLLRQYFRSFRAWDAAAAARIRSFAAISEDIAGRIRASYGRGAQVIHPPVEVERFHPQETRAPYYLVLSRLVAHKRIDVIVAAFSALGLPLKIVGDGPCRPELQRRAGANIEFLGFRSEEEVARLLGRARGLVCAAEEDFGIALVEAQAAGCPVLAYGRGGALETVLAGITGSFFEERSVEALCAAVWQFERECPGFRPADLVVNASRFRKADFQEKFLAFVNETMPGASAFEEAAPKAYELSGT